LNCCIIVGALALTFAHDNRWRAHCGLQVNNARVGSWRNAERLASLGSY
jgi:hypothetical protein